MENNKKLTEAIDNFENLKYEQFINELNSGKIKKMSFLVKGYGHYKNCSIVLENAITNDGKIITVTLAKNEECTFYGNINESEKLFNIKGKGTFTLKEMWDKLEIKEIVRN